jgi:hypothetical protein
LSVLLEDALSAAAGRTVIPPDIYPVAATLGGPNWAVDVRLLDGRMLDAFTMLQDRCELATEHSSRLRHLRDLVFPRRDAVHPG